MKLLLKILFFVLTIFQTNICEAKVFLFGEVVTQIRFIENAIENKNEVTINFENEIGITCKSESDLLDYRNWVVSDRATAAKTGTNFLRFGGDEAGVHFGRHGKSVMDALGKTSYNLKNYLDDANFIVNKGTYVPELNGYVRLIGGQGSAKFGFVGLNRANGNITTFHIKTAYELAKKAPNMFGY